MDCTWCCVRCKPRYKRHVDSIFPVDPKDGLVKGEMQKLTYYALTNPRKLDRIGNYLAEYLRYWRKNISCFPLKYRKVRFQSHVDFAWDRVSQRFPCRRDVLQSLYLVDLNSDFM